MGTTLKSLCDEVFSSIKDYDFINMTEEQAYEIVGGYLPQACLRFENCTQDLDDYDEFAGEFNFDLTNKNFSILANYMVIIYLERTYINTPLALKSFMGNSDFKKRNNKEMLDKVMELVDTYEKKNRSLAINNGYKNQDFYKNIVNKNNFGRIRGRRFDDRI